MKLQELLLIYRPRWDGRLSWPGWLTHSGHLTREEFRGTGCSRQCVLVVRPMYDKNVLVYIWKLNYTNLNPIAYLQWSNSVVYQHYTYRLFLYSKFFIKHFCELTSPASPRLDWPRLREMVCPITYFWDLPVTSWRGKHNLAIFREH